MRPTRAAFALCLAGAALAAPRAQEPSLPPQATFTSGVDIVQFNVSVVDKHGEPVRGLTASDFTVVQSGKPQEIVAFSAVEAPDPGPETAAWTRDVGSDVTSNDLKTRRLVVLLMDDGYLQQDHGESRSAKLIAHSVIDQLSPNDLAAVAFTFLGRTQNFTADRALLSAAVDSFIPHSSPPSRGGGGGVQGTPIGCVIRVGGCAVEALAMVGRALEAAPPGRKILVYIGRAGVAHIPSMEMPGMALQGRGIQEAFEALQLANVTLFAVDPVGIARREVVSFADSTGGRSLGGNEPWTDVPQVFRQIDAYYILAFRSSEFRADDRFRFVDVKVDRPDVEIRTRLGYIAPKPEKPKVPKGGPPSALDAAVSRGMPAGDLAMEATTAVFAVPGRRDAEVAIVTRVHDTADNDSQVSAPPGGSRVRRVDALATAFDVGWVARGKYHQTIELALKPGPAEDLRYELLSRLRLAPGRYEIRVAADSRGRAGSVFADIDVPDFTKDGLSASGVVVSAASSSAATPANILADLLPVVPTAARQFARADAVTAFMRFYQGGKRALTPVDVVARIVDTMDRPAMTTTSTLEAATFASGRAADYRVDLPLATLAPGEYLLLVEATQARITVRRTLRFSVK